MALGLLAALCERSVDSSHCEGFEEKQARIKAANQYRSLLGDISNGREAENRGYDTLVKTLISIVST